MEMNPETLKLNKMFEDIYDLKPTQRVPIMWSADNAFCLDFTGVNLRTDQYDIDKNLEAIEKVTALFDTDVVAGVMLRIPALYKVLGARNFVMGADGFIQHPNIHGMEVEDYDDFIKDPYKTIWDKVFPRLYGEIEKGGYDAMRAAARSFFIFFTTMGKLGGGYAGIANKLGKSTYSLAAGAACVPFDTLCDQLRSFTGIMADIRRIPQKVIDACDALVPFMLKAGISQDSSKYVRTFIPLHMGPYMKPKDFEKFYWPSFKAFVEGLDAAGTAANIFVEQDYTPYVDYLADLPKGQLLYIEYGDPKLFKDKLGEKHILMGMYPLDHVRTGTPDKCVDEAKKLLDIVAPGGKYIFACDKQALHKEDVNEENLKAVLSYVKNNTNY